MKRTFLKIFAFMLLFFFPSCIKEERMDNTPLGNFEELWKIIDERYCFLEYKEIDWDAIHIEYKNMIYEDMSDQDLFQILAQMLDELKDGHVNLYSGSDITQYTAWFDEYPPNFNKTLVAKYLGINSKVEGCIKYAILPNNTGYMYCGNFSEAITRNGVNNILTYMANCDALIIDVRNNGGGSIGNAVNLASHFTDVKRLTGYIQHKTDKERTSFSAPKAIYIEPSSGIYWNKPVAVLTNRQTFSAGNYFVNCMRYFPNVITVGDITGGGSGLPFTSELPNGWGIRFSTSPHFNAEMNHIEFGIDPDYKQNMNLKEEEKGIDGIIDLACFLLMH